MNKELEWLQEYVRKGVAIGGFDDEDIEMLNKIEKDLKALEILKETCVVHLKTIGEECFIADSEYLIHIRKDNYNLIKGVLK